MADPIDRVHRTRTLVEQLGAALPAEPENFADPRFDMFYAAHDTVVNFLLAAVEWDADLLDQVLAGPDLPEAEHLIVWFALHQARRSIADPLAEDVDGMSPGRHLARCALLVKEFGDGRILLRPSYFRACDVEAAIALLPAVAEQLRAEQREPGDEDDARLLLVMFEPTLPDRRREGHRG